MTIKKDTEKYVVRRTTKRPSPRMRGYRTIEKVPSEYYQHIAYLVKAIDQKGSRLSRRGKFSIALGGYDMGYQLSFDGIPLCAVNFDYRTFEDYGTGYDFGIDMERVKQIFERITDCRLKYLEQ